MDMPAVLYYMLLFHLATHISGAKKQIFASSTLVASQPPSFVQLQFNARGHMVEFNLTRSSAVNNFNLNENLPVLIGERGRVIRWNTAKSSKNHYAVYEDAFNKASLVRVFCHEKARFIYMGSFSINTTMYAMKPLATDRLSHTPYTDKFIDVIIDSVTYRIVPVDTMLDFSDILMHTALGKTTLPKNHQVVHSTNSRHRNRVRSCHHIRRHHKRRFKECKLKQQKKSKLRSILQNSSKQAPTHNRKSSRRVKRQATKQNYVINMLVVVDYAIYYRWYIESAAKTVQTKRADAMQNIVYYYSNIINGVNMRYSSIIQPDFSISVRFAGIYAATTPTDSPFTEGPDVKLGVRYSNPYKVLSMFGSFVVDTLQTVIPFDQATLFTGNKLIVNYSDGSNGTISGLASIEGICRGNLSVTVSYEGGEYSSTQTAAHELGHNLGAAHDGAGNNCSSEDQYLMASGPQFLTDRTFSHPFNFSPCSVNYFRQFLNIQTASCLFDSPSDSKTTKTSVYPGQRFSADRQCQIIYGPQSFYCAGGSRDRSICREMKCWVPSYNDCFAGLEQRAFEGTSCGNRMLCLRGSCVANEIASTTEDSCIYGDYKGYFALSDTLKMNCSMIGLSQPWRCYDLAYSLDCCQTCSIVRNSTIPDCEYGDNDWSGICSAVQRHDCYDETVRKRCCVTCEQLADRLAPVDCEFGNKASWCNQAVFPSYQCYTQALSTCCASCFHYYTAVPDCEYGDRVNWCRSYSELNCTDSALASQCCGTCKSRTSAAKLLATASTTVSTMTQQPPTSTTVPTTAQLPTASTTASMKTQLPTTTTKAKFQSSAKTLRKVPKRVPNIVLPKGAKLTKSPNSKVTMAPYVKMTTLKSRKVLTKALFKYTAPALTTPTVMTAPLITSPSSPTSDKRNVITVTPRITDTTLRTTAVPSRKFINRSCPLGDGASFCSTLPAEECYSYEHVCCKTCPKYFTQIPGCEYGDMVGWCATYVQSVDECRRPEVAIYCCQTCANIRRQTTAPVCTDKAEWCFGMFPGYCYDSSVESTCCATCSNMRTRNKDCQYGDRFTWCDRQFCSQNALECCASCRL